MIVVGRNRSNTEFIVMTPLVHSIRTVSFSCVGFNRGCGVCAAELKRIGGSRRLPGSYVLARTAHPPRHAVACRVACTSLWRCGEKGPSFSRSWKDIGPRQPPHEMTNRFVSR